MTTLLISQTNGSAHATPSGHVERQERIEAAAKALSHPRFGALTREMAGPGDLELAELVHSRKVMDTIRATRPAEGIGQIDPDTFVSSRSLEAAATALGGVLRGVEAVILGEAHNAFVLARPPGHHAERDRSMGFCLVNTIAIAARQAQRLHGAERVAIIDFDVHHGNGTQDIFADDPSVFYASSHQMPLYPGTGAPHEDGVGNIVNAALPAGSGGAEMRVVYKEQILPALDNFAPDLILVSAGFDAERRDPLAQLEWVGSDFAWLTGKLMDIAEKRCSNRLVSMLEGGYDLGGLASGVSAHVGMLLTGEAGPEYDD
ncbi:histone deacetylase family protein [Pelagibacterium flavum]|uniref:Histone deacetylase family protein n=1 Tax=Pelagibacterium flavum TaxID=2984530 RepID=A0ABY6ILQ9_9HYPH|nr:histone deacetylase family protein [Pelagibacterium sp. YIM 151497]MAN76380.1 acetoin utilization protein [Hyphomicrobiales bacterium]UYQ71426.1 histone deacetylase family protein [Pelagibacterium sp. YIM 151497]